MIRIAPLLSVLAALLVPVAASAHEFWIDPLDYRIEPSDSLIAELRNGQVFSGRSLAHVPKAVVRFELSQGGARREIAPRLGDRPAVNLSGLSGGLAVVIHETSHSVLTYNQWQMFEDFVAHKDLGVTRQAHLARGLPETGFQESYRRFAKSLVAVGSGRGQDAVTGMEIEIVALANPYTDDVAAGLPVQVLYQGAPRTDAQVELFDKAPDQSVTVTLHRTDGDGRAVLPVTPGHSYLVDSVVLRPAAPDDPQGAVWESLWASLTFAVP